MLERLSLRNVGPAPEMDLRLAPRLNLLTGDNGLGKSFLLDVAFWSLTRRWPRDVNPRLTSGYGARPADPKKKATISFTLQSKTKRVTYESSYSPADQAWIGKAGRPWDPGLVIYAHADGGFSIWDPARNFWRTRGGADVMQDRMPAYVFSSGEIWDGLVAEIDGKPTTVCNGLVRDWASWINKGGDEAHNMEWVLRQLSPPFNPASYSRDDPADHFLRPGPLLRLGINDARDVPSLRMPYGEPVPILLAAAGIRRVVALAYVLLWSWQEHRRAAELLDLEPTRRIVLLIDEIESHLHPSWQRTILRSILAAMVLLHSMGKPEKAALADIQLIAATHSPLILASAEPLFDPERDAWFDLDLVPNEHGRHVELTPRPFVRRGDVSRWLTSEAFDLRSTRSVDAERVLERAAAALADESFDRAQAQVLHDELRKVLPDDDPFWLNWRFVGERRGWLP